MTLYILFDYLKQGRISYDTKFYVTPAAASEPPSKLGLKTGTYIKVRDLIGALVTKSANDGAATVAENIAGSVEKFARLMTVRAKALGLTNTVFKNASGLPNDNQKTTARDMARLSLRIMNDFPKYASFFKTRTFKYKGKAYRNHNGLLKRFRGMEGIKTGYTRASGFNLTTSVRRGNKHLIAVVMGGKSAKSRDKHMAYLLTKYLSKASSMKSKFDLAIRMANLSPEKSDPANITAATKSATIWTKPNRVAKASQKAALLIGKPTSREPFKVRKGAGDYDIQIGSFPERHLAVQKLKILQADAGSVLNKHAPYVMKFVKDSTTYHRARFAGFQSRDEAKATCTRLKKALKTDCLPMPK
jgi:D-alanyl-D-alanine carboxypeptidase